MKVRYSAILLLIGLSLSLFITGSFAESLSAKQLEEEINMLKEHVERLEQAKPDAAKSGTILNPKISLDALFTVGGATEKKDEIAVLQGGAHDPNRQGVSVQNIELTMSAAVDPYLDAAANLVFQINADGESTMEVEEVFFTTRALPYGLQVKGGQFFTEFGRLNNRHPHTWAFVDQPVINTRVFGGDGLRNPGMRLSWLAPLPWYSELYLGFQNANGETAASFNSVAGEDIGGHLITEQAVSTIGDLLYSARLLQSFDLSDTATLNFGMSTLSGPNGTGPDKKTEIYGIDIYIKWAPLSTSQGFPFLSWQTEWITRRYEAAAYDDGTSVLPDETLKDAGIYTQFLWGIKPRWVLGLRYDSANGENGGNDPMRDSRKRYSSNITWYPTEFSKLRLQYNNDSADHLSDTVHAVWFQFEFMIGAHAPHIF